MIPKIIHYCWFGPKPFSCTVRKCLKTWRKHLSDYEFCFWNEQTCAVYAAEHHLPNPMEHPFVQSAYRVQKYAFVADYVRFWALYHIGGIYLDTDMYVLRPFDALLQAQFFCGWETATEGAAGQCATAESGGTVSCGALGACALGACALGACARDILQRYDELRFDEAHRELFIVPRIITPVILQHSECVIYPYDYFYPFPFSRRTEPRFMRYVTHNTYAVHLWDISWISPREKFLHNLLEWLKRFKHA